MDVHFKILWVSTKEYNLWIPYLFLVSNVHVSKFQKSEFRNKNYLTLCFLTTMIFGCWDFVFNIVYQKQWSCTLNSISSSVHDCMWLLIKWAQKVSVGGINRRDIVLCYDHTFTTDRCFWPWWTHELKSYFYYYFKGFAWKIKEMIKQTKTIFLKWSIIDLQLS